MSDGSAAPPPSTAPAPGTPIVQRVLRRGRFHSRTLRNARLRGAPLALGPRVAMTLGPQGRFERGRGCTIAGDFHGQFHGHVRWGSDVFFNVGCYVSVFESLEIGDHCRFGERVSIHDEDHVFEPRGADREAYTTAPVVIGNDVWVGAGAIILRGSRIGEGSVVAAGAVVKGEVPPHSLAAGVPARVVRPLR
ncbi:acyltransferase [Kineococcus rubinsiae]|uniref:acyltransferase n=1 Tax=Kineococcus rubinsiae TaxID=2609562 RepID=UPI001AD8F244|nr:acyltransferase [Kineococcus rubinsiae]